MAADTQRPRGNPRVAPTAYFTAQTWYRAGFAGAELFDTWRGRLGYDAAEAALRPLRLLGQPAGHFLDFLRLRHQWLEQRLHTLAPALVVEIGAGLSPRGLVYARSHPGATYLEVDLPDMVAAKRRLLRGTTLPDNYLLHAVDLLAEDFADTAWRLVRPARGPCLVITEGVTDYLDFDEKRLAWTNIAALLRRAGGGRYLLEIHPRERFRGFGPPAAAFLLLLGRLTGRGFARRLFRTTAEAVDALRACGFDAAEALDTATLDAGTFQVPRTGRFFDLVEARVEARS